MKTLEQLAREAGGVLMYPGDDDAPAEFNMTTEDLVRFRSLCRAEAMEDPHREHWAAIAKAAEAIGASPNCGPEQAAEFCRAIDRLSAALMGEEDK